MFLGAYLAAAVKGFNAGDPVAGIDKVSNDLFPGFGIIALIVFALGLIAVIVLNMYGGSLTLISSIDSFKKVAPTLRIRVITVVITAAISGVLAIFVTGSFASYFFEIPVPGAVLLHPVDRGQPDGLLHRSQGPLRDRRDLQAARDLPSLGLAGHRRLPRRRSSA